MNARSMAEMVRHQNPLTVTAGATLQEACAAMHERRFGAVLVTDGHKLLGIFTGRDAVHALAVGLDQARTLVGQVMTAEPCCLGPQDRAMEDGAFRHLPVVEDGRLLGIVSRYDFCAQEHRRMDKEIGFSEVLR